uniref:Uncharacterized protein n=1 Tax=Anopheles farauti TaxID=69004 RepID=A0A182QJS0_9DIPT
MKQSVPERPPGAQHRAERVQTDQQGAAGIDHRQRTSDVTIARCLCVQVVQTHLLPIDQPTPGRIVTVGVGHNRVAHVPQHIREGRTGVRRTTESADRRQRPGKGATVRRCRKTHRLDAVGERDGCGQTNDGDVVAEDNTQELLVQPNVTGSEGDAYLAGFGFVLEVERTEHDHTTGRALNADASREDVVAGQQHTTAQCLPAFQ